MTTEMVRLDEAARHPLVVAEVLARGVLLDPVLSARNAAMLQVLLYRRGITATEEQARALLNAVSAWDDEQRLGQDPDLRGSLDRALDDIVGGAA